MKVAVITPYWREDKKTLKKCIDSVSSQTYKATHIIVADGNPQTIDNKKIIHIKLPFNIGNSGATPRGLGAKIAFDMGFDAVAFLDADNWFDKNHIASCVKLQKKENLDVVFARRNIIFPDGEVLKIEDPQDKEGKHVDTNCFFISKRASFLVNVWLMWPKEFGTGEDRILLSAIRKYELKTQHLMEPTVWYQTNWANHYSLANKTPTVPLRNPLKRAAWNFEPLRFEQMTGLKTHWPKANKAIPPRLSIEDDQSIWVVAINPSKQKILNIKETLKEFKKGELLVINCNNSYEEVDGRLAKTLTLPYYQNFETKVFSIGSAIAFQSGAEAVCLIKSNSIDLNYKNIKKSIFHLIQSKLDIIVEKIVPIEATQGSKEELKNPNEKSFNSILLPVTSANLGIVISNLKEPNHNFIRNLKLAIANKIKIGVLKVINAP